MGGEIFVGVRYKDKNGEIKEQLSSRWTNPMPLWGMSASFLDQEKDFDTFIERPKETNEWPQSVLVHEIECGEYGVYFIDFITKEIYSRNDYFTPSKFNVTSLHSDITEDLDSLACLIDRGYIGKIIDAIHAKWDEPVEINTFIESAKKQMNEDKSFMYYIYTNDKYPFKIDEKNNRSPKLKEVKGWLKKNGWTSPVNSKSFTERY